MSWRVQATAGKPRRKRSLKKDGTPRAKPVDWEGQEQAVVIRWLLGEKMRGSAVGKLYDVTYHVPNGGQRHKATAAALKRQGVKAGVSDLVVMDARGGWFGLYLEFKATPPRHAALAESQREWLELAEGRGYCARLARGVEEAKAVLTWYAAKAPTWTDMKQLHGIGSAGTEWRKGESDDGDGCTGTDTTD
ncbi:VRR-NUC domain-containing protein [Halomonas daqingensis]|uniref:VRR-NUC domain-containing protein n=1 Tax=Billgrantia desiderata TaxID=52021 RepID=A0ABS9B4A8_9GAMM|nr:VRR-NUC domain-containing protein [Halomonas desiderata]MCE8042454.1 VRR-NUC domain-containing protein [Halomonas desiderata]MCE8047029.1 VRR-NUC domain-containing protein [Halomonas desiderata]